MCCILLHSAQSSCIAVPIVYYISISAKIENSLKIQCLPNLRKVFDYLLFSISHYTWFGDKQEDRGTAVVHVPDEESGQNGRLAVRLRAYLKVPHGLYKRMAVWQ